MRSCMPLQPRCAFAVLNAESLLRHLELYIPFVHLSHGSHLSWLLSATALFLGLSSAPRWRSVLFPALAIDGCCIRVLTVRT